jgi:hypothetical protein
MLTKARLLLGVIDRSWDLLFERIIGRCRDTDRPQFLVAARIAAQSCSASSSSDLSAITGLLLVHGCPARREG